MRPLQRPDRPADAGYSAYTAALVNAGGYFCSFCEKALVFSSMLFHKQRGGLLPNDPLSTDDWPHLLVCCDECAECAGVPDVRVRYLWPDELTPPAMVFRYTRVEGVPWRVVEDEKVLEQGTAPMVVVSVAEGLDGTTASAAAATLALFKLNGRHTQAGTGGVSITLSRAARLRTDELRPGLRLRAYDAAVASAAAFVAAGAKALAHRRFQGWARGQMAMVSAAVDAVGFPSTWEAAFVETLAAADPRLPFLLLAAVGRVTEPEPLSRKRSYTEMVGSLTEAGDERQAKRIDTEGALMRMLRVK